LSQSEDSDAQCCLSWAGREMVPAAPALAASK